ncbi:MAG: sugar ABC transporter permease [Pseudobutyrivibrio sp.]|nr:sugar ABC transporter permease [Pseudobutyrivibrio sp.]
MKQTNTHLLIKYRMPALLFTLLCVVSIILPYASVGENSIRIFTLFSLNDFAKTMAGLYIAGVICSLVIKVLVMVRPIKSIARMALVLDVISAGSYSVLLFGSKSILDKAGIFDAGFMVKDFGIGYWLGLVMAYVALTFTMKLCKISTGYIVLTWLSIIWLFPILWIVLTSLRAESGYYVGYFIPRGFTLDNYKALFSKTSVIPFGKWWFNTFIVAICSCIISSMIVLMTSYVLSRVRFSWRGSLMRVMLIIGMFPGFMSMIAVYNILKGAGLSQSLGALIVVNVAGAAMGYYICKGFLDTIPRSLDEAAIIDGATRFQIFTRVTIPLSKPIIIYTVLTSFIGPWGDYIFPSMLLGDKQNSYTVAIGLKWMTDFRRINNYYTQFAAGAVLVSIPIVILFVALQRFYVEGLSGAVKG